MPISYQSSEPDTIQKMFNSIAKRYDLANAILSFQLHKRWNKRLVQSVAPPAYPHVFLDLCSGTGDIACHYLRHTTAPCQTFLVDFSAQMLAYAKQKMPLQSGFSIQFIEADVHHLPFEEAMADRMTMAYGIRNVQDPFQCLQEAYRVLKPGGAFGILELTRPKNRLLRLGHQGYLKILLPLMGKWLTDNADAYRYLCNSIQHFIEPEKLEMLLQQAGFIQTSRLSLAGGIATLLVGHKP